MALISGPTVETAISDPGSDLAKLAATEKDDARLVGEIFLRVLSRPATPGRSKPAWRSCGDCPRTTSNWRAPPAERKTVGRSHRPAGETASGEYRPDKGELEAYQKQIAQREADRERQRQRRLAQAEAALRESEARLTQRLTAWEQQAQGGIVWTPLDPVRLSATNGAQLAPGLICRCWRVDQTAKARTRSLDAPTGGRDRVET